MIESPNVNIWKSFSNSLKILSPRNRRKFLIAMFAQGIFGILDLVGVMLIAAIGAVSIRGIESQEAGDRVSRVLTTIGIESYTLQQKVLILGTIALTLLILKTILSVIVARRILFFLANQGAVLSDFLLKRVFGQNLTGIRNSTSDQFQYSTGFGVWSISLGILGVGSTIFADLSLILIMGVGIFIVDPLIAVTSLILFSTVGLILYALMKNRAKDIGSELASLQIASTKQLSELIDTYRENFVRNTRYFYVLKISNLRRKYTKTFAEQTFLPSISKYVIEITIIVGTMFVAFLQFYFQDASRAAAGLALFMAAASRVAPAFLRLQQSFIQMQSSIGSALPTLNLIEEMAYVPPLTTPKNEVDWNLCEGFSPAIEIDEVDFSYPNSNVEIFQNLCLKIEPGKFVAIVGPSGSGKSTLVDLILGLLEPQKGKISISGEPPLRAIERWPGEISYMPQEVGLIDGSIAENIALGFTRSLQVDQIVSESVRRAGLENFIMQLPDGLETQVGQQGYRLSGGQKQKIGLARALFTSPSILILDEATSSLDSESEFEVSNSIKNLEKDVTLIVIAHRLSTIKEADLVIYVTPLGTIVKGNFDYVRSVVPDFDRQANLMGL